MADVEIYTTRTCPYCSRAKALLTSKGVAYREIDVSAGGDLRDAMTERAHGGSTVPQIFIGGRHVGGCDDLYELERSGCLTPLLGLAA
jgi:glutaredoxin 3